MNILKWNVPSIISNKPFILSATDKLSPSIICLQETNAKEKDHLTCQGSYVLQEKIETKIEVEV